MTDLGADLEEATRVIPVDDDATATASGSQGHNDSSDNGGRYETCLSDDWEIWGPNGGYLAAIALRAAGMSAQIERPASFYCHFLSSPAFDTVQLDVSVLKRGRRAESFAVAMTQQGKPILQALVKTAAHGPGYEHLQPDPPVAPPPSDLKTLEELQPERRRPNFRFWHNIERRPVDQSVAETLTEALTAPVIREWARFRPRPCFEDAFVDAARALILLDTYGFPAAYQRYRSWEYLAPNLDTSAWFHHFSPASEWLLVDHECVVAEHGLLAVSGKVWDRDGRLLASGSAQLCCVPNRR